MPVSRHTYIKTHKVAGRVLSFDTTAEETKLRTQASRARSGRSGRTFVKEGRLRVTLVALRKGTTLGAHHVEGDFTLHIVRGALEITSSGRSISAKKGGVIALRAGIRHEAVARSDTTVLITTAMR